MDRNIKSYYFRQFFQNLSFFLPVFIIFYEALGLDLTQIFILRSISSLSGIIFVIPAGLLGDKIGKKRILLLGEVLLCLIVFFYLYATNFFEFVILEFFVGWSYAFMETEIPFVSDSLRAIGKEADTTKIFANGNTSIVVSSIVGNLAFIFLFNADVGFNFSGTLLGFKITFFQTLIGFRITFFATLLGYIISLMIGIFYYKEPKLEEVVKTESFIFHLKRTFIYCKQSSYLIFFIFMGSLFISLSMIGYWFTQPYYSDSNLPIQLFGILFAITGTFEAITTKLSEKIEKKIKLRKTILLINTISVVAFLGMGLTFLGTDLIYTAFAIIFVIIRQMGYAFSIPIFDTYVNFEISAMEKIDMQYHVCCRDRVPSTRATAYSVYSLIYQVMFLTLSPLMGYLADTISISFTFLLIFLIFLIALIINFFVFDKLKRQVNLTESFRNLKNL